MIRPMPASKVVPGDTVVLKEKGEEIRLSIYAKQIEKQEVLLHSKERREQPLRLKADDQIHVVIDGAAMLRRSHKAADAEVAEHEEGEHPQHADNRVPVDGGEPPLPQGETLGPVEPPAVWKRTPVFDEMVEQYGYNPLDDRLTEYRWAEGIPEHAAGVHARE